MEKNTNVINLYVPILGKCSFQVFTNRDEDVLPAQEMEDEDVVELVLPRVEAVRRLLVHVHLQLHLHLLSCTQIIALFYSSLPYKVITALFLRLIPVTRTTANNLIATGSDGRRESRTQIRRQKSNFGYLPICSGSLYCPIQINNN